MKIIKVVCGIIWDQDKIFIARRKPEKSMGGCWEFPGGKIEANENPEQALERELKEELGMIVKVGEYFCSNLHHYENFSIELIAYQARFIYSTYILTDHDAYEWKVPKELIEYKWADADVPIFEKILNNNTKT
jgi:8-oxo-dGTP diphosphatase